MILCLYFWLKTWKRSVIAKQCFLGHGQKTIPNKQVNNYRERSYQIFSISERKYEIYNTTVHMQRIVSRKMYHLKMKIWISSHQESLFKWNMNRWIHIAHNQYSKYRKIVLFRHAKNIKDWLTSNIDYQGLTDFKCRFMQKEQTVFTLQTKV